jgi:hypothetical protein
VGDTEEVAAGGAVGGGKRVQRVEGDGEEAVEGGGGAQA